MEDNDIRDGMTIDEVLKAEGDEPEVKADAETTELDDVREELGIGTTVDPISALLDAPAEAPTDTVPISRLGTKFVIVAITDDKAYDRLVDQCTSYVKNRRGAGRTREVDGRRLARLTVAEYCTSPPFKAKYGADGYEALAAKFGTKEPDTLVDRALLMGEIDLINERILTLSGFDDDLTVAGN